MHAYAHTHTHSLTTKNFLTLSRLDSKLFFKPCLSICRKNSTELLPHSPHFVYETFSKDLNGILNTHIAAKKPPNPNPTHTNTTPPPSFFLSLCALGLVGYSWSKTFFPLSFSSGLSTQEQNSSNRPIPEHDDVLRRTQTLTCGCLSACGGVRNLCRCLCSVRPVNQTCPPHNSRSSVPPHIVLFFGSHKCLIEWGKKKMLPLWVHQSQENKTKQNKTRKKTWKSINLI